MTDSLKDRDAVDVREALDSALIRAAFTQIQRREIEALEAELAGDTQLAHDADAFAARAQSATLRLIARRINAQHRRRIVHETLPRIAQYTAAVLLVCFIGGATAVATVPAVRQQIMKLMIRMEETHADIRLAPNEELSVDVPEGWEGSYFPSLIPDGYELLELDCFAGANDVYYLDAEDHLFYFSEYGDGAGISLDTENAKISYREINGWQTMLVEKEGGTTAVWSEFDRIFMLSMHGGTGQIIPIIESVTRIN